MSDDATLAVQKAIRARLIASAGVTALVAADAILDRNTRPEVFPCILIGEDQLVDARTDMQRSVVTVYSTMHLWTREQSLTGVKEIANEVRRALRQRLSLASADYHCVDSVVRDMRFLRDPSGEHSHGVVTVESMVQERWMFEV